MSTLEMICWGIGAAWVFGMIAYLMISARSPVWEEVEYPGLDDAEENGAPAGGGF